jgi:uncharacterized protein with HEPN domain
VPSDPRAWHEPRREPHPGVVEREAKLRFRDWRFRVRDILAALRAVAAYTDGMTYEQFCADQRTADAVVRNLMTMGESIRWIPEVVLDQHPAVPWRIMRAVRNVVVHEYFGIDSRILWATVRYDLPPLVPHLEAVLAS